MQKQNWKLSGVFLLPWHHSASPIFLPCPFPSFLQIKHLSLNYNSPNTLACNSPGWTRFHYCSHTRPISLDSLLGLEPTICLQHLSNLLILGLSLPTTRHLNHTKQANCSQAKPPWYSQNSKESFQISISFFKCFGLLRWTGETLNSSLRLFKKINLHNFSPN